MPDTNETRSPSGGSSDISGRSRLGVLAGRVRLPLLYLALLLVVVDGAGLIDIPAWLDLGAFAFALLLYFRLGTAGGAAVRVGPPVEGSWQAFHTPAHKVPSHGLHAYAQTYALDLNRPHDQRSSRWWPLSMRPERYPTFGQPVLAVDDGQVVDVSDWQRDHRSRDSLPAIVFVFIEGAVREVLGPAGLLGNHITLRLKDGTYATYAHLRRRSARVEEGDHVEAGQVLAECGNSGNSSEPHLHFQVQDRRSLLIAAGQPVAFDGLHHDGEPADLPPRLTPVDFDD